jgi:phosphoglucosamine mutase
MLATMIRRDQPLASLASVYQPMPEANQSVPLNGKPVPSDDAIDAVRKSAEDELVGTGRVVIRPSGTEPVIRIMVQHEKAKVAEGLAKQLAKKIAAL